MKKITAFLLIISTIVALSSCAFLPQKYTSPVNFYYLRDELTYGKPNSVISHEIFEAEGHLEDYRYLITQYLQGPYSEELADTFPPGITVEGFFLEDGAAFLHLESEYSTLSGLDLSIACACLTKTITELTGTSALHITTSGNLLDGSSVVTMTMEDVLLLDQNASAYAE